MPLAKFTWHCTCGASARGVMPLATVEQMREIWHRFHHGHGHGQCDPQTAAKARARLDRGARKQEPGAGSQEPKTRNQET